MQYGYWTEIIAKTAKGIFATDVNEDMIEMTRLKNYSNTEITFGIADFYKYQSRKKYESLFGGFIWSHIQLQDLDNFLGKISEAVKPGGTVVFIDNNYVTGSNHAITKTYEQGNTFQTRKLENETSHLVRKNFPTEAFIKEQLRNIATEIKLLI